MGEAPKAGGPDLAAGVDESALEDGRPLAGVAHGEAVLLVKLGARVHAVGATCTHWGVSLSGGLAADGTLTCPAHHACFELASGRASAPGLAPLSCFQVEREGGRVRVGARLPDPSPERRVAAPARVVVVGAGAAGLAPAEARRAEGHEGSIVLVGPEAPCDRPNLSKDYLAGTAEESWLFLRSAEQLAASGLERIEARAASIDRASKARVLEDGRRLPYDALLLATGAEPVVPIPAAPGARLRTLRTVEDARALAAGAAAGGTIAIVGAGFLGLEAASALRSRGLEVTVIAPDEVPLGRVLGPRAGARLARLHEASGVRLRLATRVEGLEAGGVRLADGALEPASLVLVATGVRPSTSLAEAAGLAVQDGVVVDGRLRTSDPAIFAAGDAARFPDPRGGGETLRVEHWAVAQRLGAHAARSILGAGASFAEVPFFWTTQHGLTVRYVGHAARWDRADVAGDLDALDAAIAYRRGGRTLAVATFGRERTSLEAERALRRGDEAALAALVPPER